MKNRIFYKAPSGATADIIPFFDKESFHLFYLHDFRDVANHGEGTPWYHLETRNFVDYKALGEALPRGMVNDQDLYVFTGCVIKTDQKYHIFYTGHNPHFRKDGKPEQAVMHAISDDLSNWTKLPEDTFFSPLEGYEPNDWRDPFVFFNEEKKEYWMLLAARKKNGGSVRRGCTALCTSTDLKKWMVAEPLWEPHYHYTHECPDLFKIGKWWYLIYSEFSDKRMTRYRMARNLSGPWYAPKDDQFDGRSYYAAKSASDGGIRALFGWVPTKTNNEDAGSWQWGGNLVAHEIFQRKNGELGERPLKSIKKHLSKKTLYFSDTIDVDATGRCEFKKIDIQLPETYMISLDINMSKYTNRAGVSLRRNHTKDEGYVYIFDASRQRFAFDRFPNSPWHLENFQGVSRHLLVIPRKKYHLDIIVEGDVCVAYVDDNIALSSRMHQNEGQPPALFSIDGKTSFSNIKITTD
ncbi:MAG TPA: hypothetical protein DCM23_02220 [Firmicutes bacterium]|nr:hypothetical protein [Bacillota bacterium]